MKTPPTRLLPFSRPALVGAWLLLGLLGLMGPAAAQVPERFSFQGFLEDGNGQPLAPTTPVNYSVVFRIFAAAAGPGASLWAEQQVVTVDRGNYSVILGQGTQTASEPHGDLSAVVTGATGSELYLETTVNINGSDTKLLPRLRLLPSAYAFLAKKALSVDGSGITGGTITADRLNAGVYSTITNGPVADSRLTLGLRNYITNGAIADSRLSANVLSGPIADSRLSANVARRDTANTFTGDQTINGRLANNGNVSVVGDVKLGSAAQYSAAAAQDPMRIVTGKLPPLWNTTAATVATGPGWSARRLPSNTAFWEVTFNPAFPSAPVVTSNWAANWSSTSDYKSGGSPDPSFITLRGGTSFTVYGSVHDGSNVGLETHFIAIGPR
jgi:hypothetical protein